MKTLAILIFCLLSFIGLKAQTNIYHKWPRNNAVWYDVKQTVDPQTWITTTTYSSLFMAGDSLLHDSLFIIVCWNYNQDTCYELLFEDTLNKKIIFRRYPENSIIYEFDKQLGDSVFNPYLEGNTPLIGGTIIDIDSINLGSGFRRRIVYLDPYTLETNYLIEGVGSTRGIMTIFYGNEFGWQSLICYNHNNVDTLGSASNCALIDNIESLKENNRILIYPNPANDKIHIEMPYISKGFSSVDIYLYNTEARIIEEHKNISLPNSNILNCSAIPEGLYLIKIVGKNGVEITKKIIVKH
jgi:hypothetical protein